MACTHTGDSEVYPQWFLAHVSIAEFLRAIPDTYRRVIDGEIGFVSWPTERQDTFDRFVQLTRDKGLLVEQTSNDEFAGSSPEELEGNERAEYRMLYAFGITREGSSGNSAYFVRYAKHFND